MSLRFYLGVDEPSWLTRGTLAGIPLFVSYRRLGRRVTAYPRATSPYAVDSGAFTEINTHGRWLTTPQEYVDGLRMYADQLGMPEWAAQQDSMCEPFVLDRVEQETGRRPTVLEHQEATVANYLTLRELAPDLPIAPTVQGWEADDYLRCVDLFRSAGVALEELPLVGIGSVCRRENTDEIERVLTLLHAEGLRMHGFGVKAGGLTRAGHLLVSADSMAWSFRGRRLPLREGSDDDRRLPGCTHRARTCAHCPRWAAMWRTRVLSTLDEPVQLGFAI